MMPRKSQRTSNFTLDTGATVQTQLKHTHRN